MKAIKNIPTLTGVQRSSLRVGVVENSAELCGLPKLHKSIIKPFIFYVIPNTLYEDRKYVLPIFITKMYAYYTYILYVGSQYEPT